MVRRHSYQPATAVDDDCIDGPTSRLLVKKAWCHGQIIGALQCALFLAWALVADEPEPASHRLFIAIAALLIAGWGWVSYSLMNARTALAVNILLYVGAALLVVESLVMLVASGHPHRLFNLAALVSTSLGLMELLAFLVINCLLKEALVRGAASRSEPRSMKDFDQSVEIPLDPQSADDRPVEQEPLAEAQELEDSADPARV